MTELFVTEILIIPPYNFESSTAITASDLPIEVITWSNGFRTITEIQPEPEPLPEEVIPPVPSGSLAELITLAREGKQVSAAQAVNLLEKYRSIVVDVYHASMMGQGSNQWKATIGRAMFQSANLAQEEIQ